jgi:hypothetical protein
MPRYMCPLSGGASCAALGLFHSRSFGSIKLSTFKNFLEKVDIMASPAVPIIQHAHPIKRLEAFASIGLAIALAIGAGIFFFKFGAWEPATNVWYYLLAWLVLGYLAAQLIALLSTAIDSRTIGFGDSVCSILPAIVGAIVGVEALQGIIKLSTFSQNALLLMICTSALEALITLWVRFTVNRKTVSFDTGT